MVLCTINDLNETQTFINNNGTVYYIGLVFGALYWIIDLPCSDLSLYFILLQRRPLQKHKIDNTLN